MNDLEGNDPRFILAEMFQVLSVDEEIYDEINKLENHETIFSFFLNLNNVSCIVCAEGEGNKYP